MIQLIVAMSVGSVLGDVLVKTHSRVWYPCVRFMLKMEVEGWSLMTLIEELSGGKTRFGT